MSLYLHRPMLKIIFQYLLLMKLSSTTLIRVLFMLMLWLYEIDTIWYKLYSTSKLIDFGKVTKIDNCSQR